MNFKIYCSKCKIVYQEGILSFLFKRKGCPICGDKRFKLALGQWDKIR